MIIEIKGVQFENKGAELMLQAIINKLSTELPSARICLAHNKNSPYLKRARVGALQKVNLRKYIFDLNRLFYFVPSKIRNYFFTRFGIVSEADVDVILDASGFAYGDQWPDLILRQVANEVARIRRLGKHYIFMPQSLGPFSGSVNQQFARKAFSEASLVFAREPSSYDHVLALVNEKSHVHQAPDFTNLLDPDIPQEYAKYQDHITYSWHSTVTSNNFCAQNYNKFGSHKLISENAIRMKSVTTSISRNHMKPLKMVSKRTAPPTTPFKTYTFNPTGGVISPISRNLTIMTRARSYPT